MSAFVPALMACSGFVLVVLVVHSFIALPGRVAAWFWGSVCTYAVVRGMGVRFITESILGARPPYVMKDPLLTIMGVSPQEVVGWAIVAYLGWWLGERFSRALDAQGHGRTPAPPGNLSASVRLFPQVLWACFFLGSIGWAVETAAGSVHWWRWTIPGNSGVLFGVPWIGIVDWAFVGIDFLMPFLLWTSRTSGGLRARWLALGAFPLHFLAHAIPRDTASEALSPFLLVHGALFGTVLVLAMCSCQRTAGFIESARVRVLPWFSLAVLLTVPAGIELFAIGRPELLISLLPVLVVAQGALAPATTLVSGAFAVVSAGLSVSFLLTIVPSIGAGILIFARPAPRKRALQAAVALGAVLFAVHLYTVRSHAAFESRLATAIRARDEGRVTSAISELESLCLAYPSRHAPQVLLGELLYRTDQVQQASLAFEAALAVKPDLTLASRYLAVIELRRGRPEQAYAHSARGLESDPDDLEMRYLAARSADIAGPPAGTNPASPAGEAGRTRAVSDAALSESPLAVETIGVLAFEVGDRQTAERLIKRGLDRYPQRRSLYGLQVRLAVASKDLEAARADAGAWARRFPDDADAQRWLAHLRGVPLADARDLRAE